MEIIKNFKSLLRQVKHYKRGTYLRYKGSRNEVINILGTGPSLQEILPRLTSLNKSGEKFFAVNDFAKSDAFLSLRPCYYTFIDPAYWADKTNEEDANNREEVYKRINELTTWELTIFIPVVFFKTGYLQQKINNSYINIVAFNNIGFYPSETKFYEFILKRNWGIVSTGNVLGAALYLSLNLGYKEIHIFGAEHSWTKDLRVNDLNQVCTIKRHFYKSNNVEELVPWRDYDTHIFKMYEILQDLSHPFLGYLFLNWYSTRLGSKVYNYTPESFIDAFERKHF